MALRKGVPQSCGAPFCMVQCEDLFNIFFMERRGIYRKGSQGHARNISSYKYYRQHLKKWRLPLTLLFALTLVFGVVPGVGNQLETSILTSGVGTDMTTQYAEQAKKALLDSLNSFVKDCARLGVQPCVSQGKNLLNDVAENKRDAVSLVSDAGKFEDFFMPQVARAACEFDLGNTLAPLAPFHQTIDSFSEHYGQAFPGANVGDQVRSLDAAVKNLNAFVKSCQAQ